MIEPLANLGCSLGAFDFPWVVSVGPNHVEVVEAKISFLYFRSYVCDLVGLDRGDTPLYDPNVTYFADMTTACSTCERLFVFPDEFNCEINLSLFSS